MTNLSNVLQFTEEQLKNLNENEREIAIKILTEYANEGKSQTLIDLYYSDYKEIPVDIITFIKDERYLGKAWHLPSGKCKLFPYWEKRLRELFPDNVTTNYNNAIFTGARGLGKSEIAVACGLYLMHRLMCLKNPYETLNLKPTEQVAFAFMNITKLLAESIGVTKFQNTVKTSPWFLARGTITGTTNKIWNPPDFIKIIVGSEPSHTIGQAIYFCLDENTVIKTSEGLAKISDVVDKKIKVWSISDDNQLRLSEYCTVKKTKESSIECQIELYDGSIIKCTPEHKLMLSDGTYKEAQYLTEDDELADIQ